MALTVVSEKAIGNRVEAAALESLIRARDVADVLMQSRSDGCLDGSLRDGGGDARAEAAAVALESASPCGGRVTGLVQYEGRDDGPEVSAGGRIVLFPIQLLCTGRQIQCPDRDIASDR